MHLEHLERVPLSKALEPTDCMICHDPIRDGMTSKRMCFDCDMAINFPRKPKRLSEFHYRRALPLIQMPYEWRLCEKLLSSLEWRVRQVEKTGMMFSTVRKTMAPTGAG